MRENIFPLAAALGFFLGCADIPEELRDEAGGKCNGRAYTEYQFCASGQVYDFCSGTPYNPSIVDCCNNHQYTKETEFCSQSNIYRKCGSRQYDPATQFCGADSEIYPKCNGSPYNPETQFCNGSTIYSKCGGSTYNPSTEFCSGGSAYYKCGGSDYNVSSLGCCGNATYPLSTQRCGSGNAIETKCGTSDWYSPSTQFCSGGYAYYKCGGSDYNVSTLGCCGNATYPISTQRCGSGDAIETKCGAYEYYNAANTNLRCQNSVVETKCGSGWYNPSTQFCNGSTIYSKCGGSTYNPSTEFCSSSYGVVSKCSGTIIYDPATQRCEDSVVETKCGTGSNYYNPSTQFCSGDSVYDQCNEQSYDLASQRCKNNVVETKCGSGWYNASNSNLRCESDVVETKCGSSWYNAANASFRCQNSVIETKCGSGWYDTSNTTQRCQNNVVEAKCGSEWYDASSMQLCSGGTLRSYKTVEIGSQVWFAENLNYNASGSKCYGNDETNCNTYGRLYNWATAMGIESTYNTTLYNPPASTKYRGVCPSGWHIPTQAEWNALSSYVQSDKGCTSCDAKHLKSTSGFNGLDSYGFAALPGGYSDGGFGGAGNFGYWWSASEGDASGAYTWSMHYNYEFAYWGNYGKGNLFSVRCLQD